MSGTDESSKGLGALGLLVGSGALVGGIFLVRTKDVASIRSSAADPTVRVSFAPGETVSRPLGTSLGGRF